MEREQLCDSNKVSNVLSTSLQVSYYYSLLLFFFSFQSRGKDLRWFPISSSSYLVVPWTWERVEAVVFYFCSLLVLAFKKTQIFLLPVGPRFQKTSNISAHHWPKGSKKTQIILKYFKNNFISFIFGCSRSSLLHWVFIATRGLSLHRVGATLCSSF